MATYYPPCLDKKEYCTTCYVAQHKDSLCTSTGKTNTACSSAEYPHPCKGSCNSTCNVAQTVCLKMGQFIKDHADVGSYPGTTVKVDDFIHEKWSADFWNSLINKIETAEGVGRLSSQGSSGAVSAGIGPPHFQTAALYNQVNSKLTSFQGASYSQVAVDQLITATVANAIQDAYNLAKFNSSVCDMCNSDQTTLTPCNCNCTCACSCNCGCSCSCSCGCSCSCPCSNPCNCPTNCSCPNNTTESGTTK